MRNEIDNDEDISSNGRKYEKGKVLRHSFIPCVKVCLLPRDKIVCAWIVNWVITQCVLVFAGAFTIDFCMWSPEHSTYDYDKLARIMYLYDPLACGYSLRGSRSIWNLQFSNNTLGLNILPIEWMPAVVTVSTKVSAKTRKYVKLSVIVHVFWLLVAIAFRIFRSTTKLGFLKILLGSMFYMSVFVIVFDLSMAIVYIAHIQQSLTKGMILRYSGWSVEMKIKHYDDFGGWLPMIASACWLRGGFGLALNIYCCRIFHLIRRRIKKSEVRTRLILQENFPIPEPKYEEPLDSKVLYYRTGEFKPQPKQTFKSIFYF
ncbi:uncharacterized protein LOC124543889 [Vanessa cardui]|uniref:uncharacterized protein LOC124543889 n=1 Tax=Vanessa cardui TaxID=171605 RepID=UPI001F12DBE6|nr:uncharacterized protein LOC124543889 [Vanessa cardui]